MLAQPKILMVDDNQDFLDLYREMLSQHLPSLPEIKTAVSGSRALAMLESEPFNLLTVDLNMPRMDGLQVISIARRKYPEMRLVVLTAIRDEQFRARAYAMGVDQYWIKPESDQEMGLFIESVETLLSRETQGGFRGVQSKSLVDIIQLECLSQTTVLLKITNGLAEGRIWIQSGEVVDAEAPDLRSEPAFQKILSWKTGSFEILPGDPTRPRTIFTSYQGLLLNTAQALDEAASAQEANGEGEQPETAGEQGSEASLVSMTRLEGVEFALILGGGEGRLQESWGLENPKSMAEWLTELRSNFESLGERLQVGQLQQISGTGPQRKVALAACGQRHLGLGFSPMVTAEQVRETLKNILTKWAS